LRPALVGSRTAWQISAAAIPPKTFRNPIKKILELLFPTAVVWYLNPIISVDIAETEEPEL
jgi:hypothetical protein